MAKAAIKNEAPAETNATAGDFDWADELPAATRKVGAETSPEVATLSSLPAPANGKFARKWFAVEGVPATITDEAEKAKATKEALRKMTNRFSGIVRRLQKKDATKAYVIRTIENNGVAGVAVYRVEPAATPATPAA